MRYVLLSSLLCVSVVQAAPIAPSGNRSVIVLVHGFMGWGRDEMLGFKYWGGINDLQTEMSATGHDVRTAAVGPISSNWDRACELYAYIKGGRVDYGAAHAAANNHSRFGRTFIGLYPEWGTTAADGRIADVHLVGHSMGGQTIRLLLHLLIHGSKEEHGAASDSLFAGGRRGWVRSITSINAPHDGTTIMTLWPKGVTDLIASMVKGFAAVAGVSSLSTMVYDFKLDQWGLTRKPKESFTSYMDRVLASPIWADNITDLSSYDLALDGAAHLNGIAKAEPDVWYFSYASVDTRQTVNPLSHNQVPELLMWEFFKPLSYTMGAGGPDDTWWPNDGVVNTKSEDGPTLNSTDEIVVYEDWKHLKPGRWNYMGCRSGIDHIEMVGMGVQAVEAFYLDIAKKLDSLPPIDRGHGVQQGVGNV